MRPAPTCSARMLTGSCRLRHAALSAGPGLGVALEQAGDPLARRNTPAHEPGPAVSRAPQITVIGREVNASAGSDGDARESRTTSGGATRSAWSRRSAVSTDTNSAEPFSLRPAAAGCSCGYLHQRARRARATHGEQAIRLDADEGGDSDTIALAGATLRPPSPRRPARHAQPVRADRPSGQARWIPVSASREPDAPDTGL
jgi:hypothetical protein